MITEERRRAGATVLACVGWFGALALTVLRTADVIPDSTGIYVVLLIGVAIAAGMSLSRMRLAKTINAVFRAGYGKRDDDDERY